MADIGSDTGSTTDVVERELCDVGVELEEEGQGLADSSTRAEDGDFGLAGDGGGEGARARSQGAGRGTGKHFGGRKGRRGEEERR